MGDYEDYISRISEHWSEFTEALAERSQNEELGIDFNAQIDGLGYSISDLQRPIVEFIEISRSANFDSTVVWLLRDGFFDGIKRIISKLEKVIEVARTEGKFNVEDFSIQNPTSGLVSLSSAISDFLGELEEVFRQNYAWLLLLRDDSAEAITELFSQYSSSYEEINRKKGVVTRNANLVEELREEVEKWELDCQAALERINAHATKISEAKVQADNATSQIVGELEAANAHLENLNDEVAKAEKLAEAVDEYQADFEALQAEMDNRFSAADELKKTLSGQISRNDDLQLKIEETQQAASEMLSSATTAGLASEFADYRNNLEGSLRGARRSFYVSIALLTIFSLPLIVMVVPPIAVLIELALPIDLSARVAAQSEGADNVSVVVEAGARLLLIFPFLWLTSFSSNRYARLFRLKEHYAYKRSIAASVDGFKKQSPDYADEIAAAAFHELTFNPADRMDRKDFSDASPNPIWGRLIEKIEKRFESTDR